MLLRLWASFYKELLLVFRDKSGMATLFIMPIVLIIVMALIMDAPFRNFQESGIKMALVNEDDDTLGHIIERGLRNSEIFTIISEWEGNRLTEEKLQQLVEDGDFKIGVVIPKGASVSVNDKINVLVNNTLSQFGMETANVETVSSAEKLKIKIFLDPATKKSFRTTIVSSLQSFTSKIESKMIMEAFFAQLTEGGNSETSQLKANDFIDFEEIYPSSGKGEYEAHFTNSVQHNVPAWSIFAMFFIVLPLAGNMIREREEGSILRLYVAPGSFLTLLTGKLLLYVLICMLQFALMLLIGIYFLPLLGLPALFIGNSIMAILLTALMCAFAATGFGVMVGTIFGTHQQATTFGSVSVVIMAAIGGIWVPLFAMPPFMQVLGMISPLNWTMEAFNDLFLRGGDLISVLPECLAMFGFSAFCMMVTYFYNRKKLGV